MIRNCASSAPSMTYQARSSLGATSTVTASRSSCSYGHPPSYRTWALNALLSRCSIEDTAHDDSAIGLQSERIDPGILGMRDGGVEIGVERTVWIEASAIIDPRRRGEII